MQDISVNGKPVTNKHRALAYVLNKLLDSTSRAHDNVRTLEQDLREANARLEEARGEFRELTGQDPLFGSAIRVAELKDQLAAQLGEAKSLTHAPDRIGPNFPGL